MNLILIAGLIAAVVISGIELARTHGEDLLAWAGLIGFGVLLIARVVG